MGGKDETNIIIVPIFFIGGMLACFGKKGHKAATDGRREGERTKYPAIKILWKRKKEIPNLVIRTSLEGRVPSFFLFFSVKTDVGHDFLLPPPPPPPPPRSKRDLLLSHPS